MTKLQKLSQTLNVSGSKYEEDKIGKDLNNTFIKRYIKTSEIPWNLEQNHLYNVSGGPPGFYVIDGAKFDKILKNYKDQDSVIRKKTLNDFKKNYPILCKQKKTQRLILSPLEKRFIWDVSLYNECIKSLCEESIFCDTNTFFTPIANSYYDDSEKAIYVDYDKNENAKNIFICIEAYKKYPKNVNPKDINQLEKFDEKNFNHISSEKIKIKNNKMNFFVPFDFEAQQFRLVSIKSEKYEERAVKCLNGEYEIKLFVDDVFLENKKKLEKYDEEFDEEFLPLKKAFYVKYNRDEDEDYGFETEESSELLVKENEIHVKLQKKYAIKDRGTHIYHIKLINDQI